MSRLSQRTLALVGFAAAAFLVVILFSVPAATGYEFSIYAAYPWYFWLVLVASIVVGQLLILRSAASVSRSNLYWGLGLLLTLVSNAILLFMPYIRGYRGYERADVLSHIGHIRHVQETGTLSGQNIYPNIHQLVLTLSYATGIDPLHIISVVPPVFSLFSVVSAAALMTTLYDRRKALFSLPFVTILVGQTAHANASPFAQSVLLLPFVVYLLVKEQTRPSTVIRIALAIALTALVIYHPLTTVFVLIFLAIYTLVRWRPIRTRLISAPDSDHVLTGSGTVNRLVLGTFGVWYYDFAGILIRFASLRDRLLDRGSGSSTLESYGTTISRTSPAVSDLVRLGATNYGVSLMLLGLAGLNLLKQLRTRLHGSFSTDVFELSFSLATVVFAGLAAVFLVFDLIVQLGRPLIFARYFALFVVGSLCYDLYRATDNSPVVPRAMTVVLAVMVLLSVVTVHHSPITLRENQQVTEAELDGSEWYFSQGNESVPVQEMGINLYRFNDALNGFEVDEGLKDNGPPPEHFGYDERATIGAGFNQSHYLVVTTSGKLFYREIYPDYPQYWRYTPRDFDRLDTDPTVNRVYANGDFETYLYAGTNRTAA